jgi:alanine racemase
MVKANAYGHDARLVVQALADTQVDRFAVCSIEEAEQIASLLPDNKILITSPVYAGMDPELVRLAQVRRYQCTICSESGLSYVMEHLDDKLEALRVHVKLDTGMGRLGCDETTACNIINGVLDGGKMELAGIFTHLATADEPDITFAEQQIASFDSFLDQTGLKSRENIVKHAANSAATFRIARSHFDMVRCGISIYGYDNCDMMDKPIDLRPAMRLEAPVVQVKKLAQGQSCGYGRTFYAPRDMLIGLVPVGYAEGLFRNLSNCGSMSYKSYNLPIIGRISMDMTIIDLSEVPEATEGMQVVVLDDRPGSVNNAASLAKQAGTISYEILTSIGGRARHEIID